VHNRDNCCQSRLRDIKVSIHDVSFLDDDAVDDLVLGIPTEEIEEIWESASFESDVLNLENELGGGGAGGPDFLTIDVEKVVGEPVVGRFVRVLRVADPDLSGTGGVGNVDEANVMSLGEVEVFGVAIIECSDEGDTHCEEISVEPPLDGGPGIHTITVVADDDSGDTVRYSLRAQRTIGEDVVDERVAGPSDSNVFLLDLSVGTWEITASVDDDAFCSDLAEDASCEVLVVEVENTTGNCALEGIASQSSDYSAGLVAARGNDNIFTNFTATASADTNPIWEVDLLQSVEIGSIVVHNRGDGCCQSRLRDLIVSIHDNPFTEDAAIDDRVDGIPLADIEPVWDDALFESAILNPDNVLNGQSFDGPASLLVDVESLVGETVAGRYVRILRISDPDLSGTSGAGGPDDISILSVGEVEVLKDSACPDDGDTHCEELLVEGPEGGGPGEYVATVFADDDSGDTILYSITAEEAGGASLSFGPSEVSTTTFDLSVGTWAITASVDDGDGCGSADTAVCTRDVVVEDDSVEGPRFVRGDANSSGTIDLTDGVVTLNFLFTGGPDPLCADAADTDDNGALVISDAVVVFSFLFTGGAPPVAPSPSATTYLSADCGSDAEGDGLDCAAVSDTCAP
jgi:hypothetical protein